MSDRECNFCSSKHWLEHIDICKSCWENFHNISKSQFVLICKTKGIGLSWMTNEDYYDILEKTILNHFQKKLKKYNEDRLSLLSDSDNKKGKHE